MRKKHLYMIGAAMLMAACSSESAIEDGGGSLIKDPVAQAEVPVSFGTYLGRTNTTRTQVDPVKGTIDNIDKLHSTTGEGAIKTGFGIFGYYTNGVTGTPDGKYSSDASSGSPINYMYNQLVEYNSTDGWTYSPIKYWPNETGNDKKAGSDTDYSESNGLIDRLTFFAYAPFIGDDATGAFPSTAPTEGITKIPASTDKGDPKITFVVPKETKNNIDLLYGTVPSDATSWQSVSKSIGTSPGNNDGKIALTAGGQYIDLVKPDINQKVKFNFKHALAQIELWIAGVFDEASYSESSTKEIDENTKIYVNSVTVKGGSFGLEGTLNLNNTGQTDGAPNWENVYNKTGEGKALLSTDGTVTEFVFSSTNNNLNENLISNLNSSSEPAITPKSGSAKPGVKHELVPLMAGYTPKTESGKTTYTPANLMVIPYGSSSEITFIIDYDVITEDPHLDGKLLKINNVITKTAKITDSSNATVNFAAGKKYAFKLYLGMTTAKVDAEVAEWGDPINTNVDLPKNLESGSGE